MKKCILGAMLLVVGCGGAMEPDEAVDAREESAEVVSVVPPTHGRPPVLREATPAVPVEELAPYYVSAPDERLRSALEPVIAEFLEAGVDVRFRGHCSWNVQCIHVFWEGVVLPERSRLACPEDVPLRRELSVDASLKGDALTAALRLQLGRAFAAPFGERVECVQTTRAFAPGT